MKRLAFLFTLALCLPLTARADDASRHAKAKEMLTLLHLDKLMDQVMDGTMQQVAQMSKQMFGDNISPADQAKIDDFQKKTLQVISAQMGWKALEPEYVDLYAKNFTEEQLDAIIAFYKSPAGLALVDKLPTLTNEGMQIAQARMAALEPQLKQMIEDFTKAVANRPSASKTSPQ